MESRMRGTGSAVPLKTLEFLSSQRLHVISTTSESKDFRLALVTCFWVQELASRIAEGI
jgi:hypothetical protein